MQSYLQHRHIRKSLVKELGEVSNEGYLTSLRPPAANRSDEPHILAGLTSTTKDEGLLNDSDRPTTDVTLANDPQLSPLQWSVGRKTIVLALISAVAFIVGWASSQDSAVIPQASKHFHVSHVSESLATGLFLVGFGVGAPFAGPLSESFGRTPVYIITFAFFCIWILGSAVAPSFAARLCFRFLAGFFGSTPFTTAGGTLGDLFDHSTRGKIFPYFAGFAFIGPLIAPVLGGYVGQSGISFRWMDWITLIISVVTLILLVLFLPETYMPILLIWKARHLRSLTGNQQIKAPLELTETSLGTRLKRALTRPVIIMITEPIVVLFTLYLTFVYMVSFSFLSSYPFIFGQTHHFDQGKSNLMFLGIVVGILLCCALTPFVSKLIHRAMEKAISQGIESGDHITTPPPEPLLIPALISSPLLPTALFLLTLTAPVSHISPFVPLLATVGFGYALLSIFISTYTYLIQTFTLHAASALVGITLIRYIASGVMVVVAIPMYESVGVRASLGILTGISCAFVPVPWIFWWYGKRIRGMSRAVGKRSDAG